MKRSLLYLSLGVTFSMIFLSFRLSAAAVASNRLWDKTTLSVCFAPGAKYLKDNEDKIIVPWKRRDVVIREASGFGPWYKPEEKRYLPIPLEEEKIRTFPSEMMKKIEKSLRLSYGPVGIDLIGWKVCQDSISDVVIFYTESGDASLSVGAVGSPLKIPVDVKGGKHSHAAIRINQGFLDGYHKKSKQYLQMIKHSHPELRFDVDDESRKTTEMTLQLGVVHELGHILGFHHEFIRKEFSEQDIFDLDSEKAAFREIDKYFRTLGMLGVAFGDPQAKVIYDGGYDSFSVMDYFGLRNLIKARGIELYCRGFNDPELCRPEIIRLYLPELRNGQALSQGDIRAFNGLYHGAYGHGDQLDSVDERDLLDWIQHVHLWDAQIKFEARKWPLTGG